MVASSQQLATLSGYKALNKGGNAIDAAVAMLSTLSVVEPHSVGIGGDAFALIYLAEEDKLIGINGSGRAPYRANLDWFSQRQIDVMPERGILSVTVPGALHAWAQVVERYGNLGLNQLLEDAIDYAENGFPVTEVIAGEWKNAKDLLRAHESASKAYLVNGDVPQPGQIFHNKDLARTYRKISSEGTASFYRGDIRDAIIAFSSRNGGLLSQEDFENHESTWVQPLATDYRGYTIYELPPNGQGVAALEMLNILEGYDMGRMDYNGPEHLHLLIEAKKAAFSDRDNWVTDPAFEDVPVSRLISKEYADQVRQRINHKKATGPPLPCLPSKGTDTAYATAVDQSGNAASFISSIYMPFGSAMVVDGTGIVLQNRGHAFSLNPVHRNKLEPHKRPLHTIIPAMAFKDGRFIMSFGVMGGDMQPQGHVQFLINLIDFKMNLQEAIDAPRIRHFKGREVYLEDGIPDVAFSALQDRGHRIIQTPGPVNQVGGGQAIYLDSRQKLLCGASDRRKDGVAIGY
jgi:gamma-glutamyltranspeptidase/glutathione hydrolase